MGPLSRLTLFCQQISSPIHSGGSCDSLNNLDFRRSSVGQSQASALDAMSLTSCFDRLIDNEEAAAAAGAAGVNREAAPFPNVPQIVINCIKHLESHGLHTVGLFRVSSSKKRVRQVRP